jgi:hypothetical protein
LLRAAADIGAARPAIDGGVDWERVEEERLAMFAYGQVSAAGASARE